MATTITNLTELQEMENNLAEDYILGNDIDASGSTALNILWDFFAWVPYLYYNVNNFVTHEGNSYYCHTYHESGATFSSTNWVLTTLNAWDYLGFKPIGQSSPYFTGTFDSKGYTISGLYINRPDEDYIGLFGVTIGDTITDAILTSVDITGDDYVGGLVGYAYESTMTGSHTTGDVKGDNLYSHYDVGGFVGWIYGSTVTSCYSTVTVASGIYGERAGGFVGWDVGGNTFVSCYATGTVSGKFVLGGFVGRLYGSSSFTSCYATGVVTGTYRYIGGFGGGYSVVDGMTISKCYATGNVISTGDYAAGGFVGDLNDVFTITDCYARGDVTATSCDTVGGFIGYLKEGTIINAYSTGSVNGDTTVGGFCADNYLGTITDCFWDTQTSGTETSDGGTGKTTAQMKTKTTFTDASWDFTDIWVIDGTTNDGYPYFGVAGTRCFTIPDLYDDHGRVAKGAWVRAYRADTFEIVKEGIIDQYGNATLCGLPDDVDIVFHVTWGGGA